MEGLTCSSSLGTISSVTEVGTLMELISTKQDLISYFYHLIDFCTYL